MNATFVQKEPIKSDFQEMLDQLHELKLDTTVDWDARSNTTAGGVQIRHWSPLIEPHFLAQYWGVITDLPYQHPFELRVVPERDRLRSRTHATSPLQAVDDGC